MQAKQFILTLSPHNSTYIPSTLLRHPLLQYPSLIWNTRA